MKRISLHSQSPAQTRAYAAALAREILATRSAGKPVVIALIGDLGAGKTEFVKGFLHACGSRVRAASPSFVVMKRYHLRNKQHPNLYHFDLYRLHGGKTLARDLALCGWDHALTAGSIVLVEWADRAGRLIPKDRIAVRIAHSRKEHERRMVITR